MKLFKYSLILLIPLFVYSCTRDSEPIETKSPESVTSRHMTFANWDPASPCRASNLIIVIDESCEGTPWDTAINEAAQEFNDLESSLNFTVVYSSNPNDNTNGGIAIDCSEFQFQSGFSNADTPQLDQVVGNGISLNDEALDECGQDDACFLRSIVMNQLGYVIGIADNDLQEGSQIGGQEIGWIEGTAPPGTSDPNSVFNSDEDCFIPCEFSSNDVLALTTLYPFVLEPCACETDIITSCYCVCEALDNYGNPKLENFKIPVDCCSTVPCSELIPDWWLEYLVYDKECFSVTQDPCKGPTVTLNGPREVCVGHSAQFCIAGNFNSRSSWSGSGGVLGSPSRYCRSFTANSPGTYVISVEVCDRTVQDGDCCNTIMETIEVVQCETECFCECTDGLSGRLIELPIDCDDDRDCDDIHFEDDIYDCVKRER